MEFLRMFGATYAEFFNWSMWMEIFTNPTNWGLIATLVLMEGILSADNAIALSVQVQHLPEQQRKKALLYGFGGAVLFRFIAIGMGTTLTKLWWIKLLGGAYLLWMMIHFFMKFLAMRKMKDQNGNGTNEDEVEAKFNKASFFVRMFGTFWATVISVELMDITFSVDSVLAAFGISQMVGILLLGGVLGILMMRGVAQLFTKLVESFPELEVTAYVIIGFIGLKMFLSTVHEIADKFGVTMHEIEVSHVQFFIFLGLAFGITFIIHYMKKNKVQAEA